MYKNIDITGIALTRPFFLLEWERGRRQLSQTELEHRLYSLQMPEIDKEIIKTIEDYMTKIRPSVVFIDGSPASEELQFCSQKVAKRYVERDYAGIMEDYRVKLAKMVGAEVVYLDDGFEMVNSHYRTQKKNIEQMFLLDEMIRQIKDKRGYHDDVNNERYRHLAETNRKDMNNEEVTEWWNELLKIFDLLPKKEDALSVYGEANLPGKIPLEPYKAAEDVLKRAKDLKKLQSLRLESKIQEGREDFWIRKSEGKISELPEGSKVLCITEASHMGLHDDSTDILNLIKKFQLPEGSIAKWRLNCPAILYTGKFHVKLSNFGNVKIIDLTQKNMKRQLESYYLLTS
jgi:nicotinamide riboside kinase